MKKLQFVKKMVLLIAAMLFVFNTSAQVLPDGTLTVTGVTAGDLKDAIESALAGYPGTTKADIKNLIIEGALDGNDFNEIQSNYAGLEVLDLNDATSSSGEFHRISSSLLTLILPQDLGNASGGHFELLTQLAAIQIADSNPNYKTVDGVLFTKDGKKLVRYPIRKPDLYYTTPAGVEELGHASFSNTVYLEAIVVSEGVTHCDEWVFVSSLALKSITFPSTLGTVMNGMIRDLKKLTQVILLCTTPPAPINGDGTPFGNTGDIVWDSWSLTYGFFDAASKTAYGNWSEPGGPWFDIVRDLPVAFYQPVVVQYEDDAVDVDANIAWSPYLYAVAPATTIGATKPVQVPIIAAEMNGTYPFKNWEAASGITIDAPSSATTFFTMTAGLAGPFTVTAVYDTEYTGIGETEAVSISVYPSPATDAIFVKGLDSNAGYTIVDIAGKMASSGFVNNEEPVNVASLSAGIYFFQINGETVKFIKK